MKKKVILWIVFAVVAFHFLKDITQDILNIASPLDLLGNANEDISFFPEIVRQGYTFLGYSSFLAEIFLLITIPFVNLGKNKAKLEKIVWGVAIFLFLFLLSSILLDPRFRI
jgi:hypothetical protein